VLAGLPPADQERKAKNPHILNIPAAQHVGSKWFKGHVAYTMAKYGMSMCVLGMAGEFRPDGIAVNACGRAPRSPPPRSR
jgi:citronellol/citronellal dehydrogenase